MDRSRGCGLHPCVLIAIAHPVMRRLIRELLNRENDGWAAILLDTDLATALLAFRPDLLVLDSVDLSRFGSDGLDGFPKSRIVVVGPEADVDYRNVTAGRGAGAWVARDELADDLAPAMRRVLAKQTAPPPNGSG